jgi:hypothetical protein
MSYAPNPEGLRSAFAAERFTFDETSLQFSLADAGRLNVIGGRIAAGDPQAEAGLEPFTQCVPDGDYPVSLAIARDASADNGGRLAYARALLAASAVANWYPALSAGQDARTLAPGEFFGFTVESGKACFALGDNSVVFSAANGRYASYFGYDAAGRVAALVTDFGVVPGIRDLPRPRRSWWRGLLSFWK